MANEKFIVLKNVKKIYDNGVEAVHDFSLDIDKHEFIVLVGPSGCGKSTTIRMIAGLEAITDGELYIDGKLANDLEPKDRNLSMVFQSYALYPHMSVYDNLAFPLRMHGVEKHEVDERVRKVAQTLEIENYLTRKPKQLSGGQRQRVALGRAIIRNTQVFLMDEPLSNLDAKLRVAMRSEIIKLHQTLEATMIYVTHDQTEAMTMASRIVVMKDGYIQQIGTPIEIYKKPINTFVATFIGSPAMNLLNANIKDDEICFTNGIKINIKDLFETRTKFYKELYTIKENELSLLEEKISSLENEQNRKNKKKSHKLIKKLNIDLEHIKSQIEQIKEINEGKNSEIIMGIRPEDIHHVIDLSKEYKKSEDYGLKVEVPELLGHEYYIHTLFDNQKITLKTNSNSLINIGDDISVHFDLDALHFFDPITCGRIK